MFGMLQYDLRKDIQFVQQDGYGGAQHSACDYCRRKKLRCSGDIEGCTRCNALLRSCAYTLASQAKTRNQRQQSKSLSPDRSLPFQAASPATTENTLRSRDSMMQDVQRLSGFSAHETQKPRTESLDTTPRIADLNSEDVQRELDCLGQIPDFDATFPQDSDIFSSLDMTFENSKTPCLSVCSSPSAVLTSRNKRQCACLDTIVFLIEDLDGTITSVHEASLDASLTTVKGALASGRRLLQCQDCIQRTESLMLLLFVCEKLVHASTSIAEQFTQQFAKEEMQLGKAQETISVMLGEYEVCSRREWRCVLKALVDLQLQNLSEYLNEIIQISSFSLPQSQHARLAMHANKMEQLRKQISD